MHIIDNIHSQLQPWLVERTLAMRGELRPGSETATASKQQLADATRERDYPGAQWRFYYPDDYGLGAQPWHIQGVESYRWWIVRLDPGCVFPTHRDTFDHQEGRRLWVPLTPPAPGHVFGIGTRTYDDYLVGGVYEFEDHQCEHGSANFGHTPRVTLQIVSK